MNEHYHCSLIGVTDRYHRAINKIYIWKIFNSIARTSYLILVILIDEYHCLDEQCSWMFHLELTSHHSGQTLYRIKSLLDCYRSCFDVLWINWMTIALAYFLKWTIFASHTETTAHDWTLAGWCCVLSSQCTSIHLMIHQCHLDLFVKCSRKMRSSIILQRYGTNVILNTSWDSDIVRWWSSYIIMIMKQTTSLQTIGEGELRGCSPACTIGLGDLHTTM